MNYGENILLRLGEKLGQLFLAGPLSFNVLLAPFGVYRPKSGYCPGGDRSAEAGNEGSN
jgi:hypothetical protein